MVSKLVPKMKHQVQFLELQKTLQASALQTQAAEPQEPQVTEEAVHVTPIGYILLYLITIVVAIVVLIKQWSLLLIILCTLL